LRDAGEHDLLKTASDVDTLGVFRERLDIRRYLET
jgi:hypothetical protein